MTREEWLESLAEGDDGSGICDMCAGCPNCGTTIEGEGK